MTVKSDNVYKMPNTDSDREYVIIKINNHGLTVCFPLERAFHVYHCILKITV